MHKLILIGPLIFSILVTDQNMLNIVLLHSTLRTSITLFMSILYFANIANSQTMTNTFEIVVSQSGDGDCRTIQEAIVKVRDYAEYPVLIKIKPGVYREKITIPPYKRNIILRGEDKTTTTISHDDYSGKRRISADILGNSDFNTYNSYTVFVGGDDCILENLTIANTAGNVGQAVALHTGGNRIIINNCSILGNQDSFFLDGDGHHIFVKNSFIEGTTDFIFGNATAYFKNCTLQSLSNSFITAASTTQNSRYGLIFDHCILIPKDSSVNNVYLGRPWRPYAKTIFLRCNMGDHIVKEGWHPWDGDINFPNKETTVYYGEYQSHGDGALQRENRVKWSNQLSDTEASAITMEDVFGVWKPSFWH